jgi:hypothetical protein
MTREHIEDGIRKRILKKHTHIDEEAFALFWADEYVQEQVGYNLDIGEVRKEDWKYYVEQYERTLKLCHAYHKKMMAQMPRDVIHGNRRLYEMRNAIPEEFLPAVNFTEFDELVIALMRETASYFAEQLPEVRFVREQLLCGEPLTEDELMDVKWYLVAEYAPGHPLNVLQVEDVAGIGLAPFLRNPPPLQPSFLPLPGSVGEAMKRAASAVWGVVLCCAPRYAEHWLLFGEWYELPQFGQFVMPRSYQWNTCIPAHLEPRTIVRIYQRLATVSNQVVYRLQAPMRVRRPSLKNLKLALEAVTRLRAGHTWKQIANDWGKPPSHAKRTLVRVWNALGIVENPITTLQGEHENGETTGEQ